MAKLTEDKAGPTTDEPRVARILLVDDQKITETLLLRMLKDELDLELHYCQNPLQAIRMAEAVRPSVILMDLMMPELDGITLVRRFRKRRAFSQLPIVMLSVEENPYIKAQAFAAGANNYLVKLPTKVEMVARLRHQSTAFLQKARHPAEKETCFDIVSSDLKGFWLIDANTGKIFDVNDTLCTMMGFSRESFLDKSPLEFVGTENVHAMETALNWIPKIDNRIHEIYLNTLMQGQLYTRFCVTTTHNTMGRVLVSSFTFLNINKLNNEYFDILKNEFRFIADSVPGLLWMSNPQHERIYFNKSWLKFRGHILEQELDLGWTEGIHPEDVNLYAKCSHQACLQKKSYALEFRLKSGDGEYHWMYESALPRFTSSGFFMGFSGSCVDITERKLIEGNMDRVNFDLERQVEKRTEELRREVAERKLAEEKERRAYRAQSVVSNLLRIALQTGSLEEQLRQSLSEILATPWLAIQKKGGIFLANTKNKTLALTAWQGLDAEVCSLCAIIPFGKCLCGRVAETKECIVTHSADENHDIQLTEILPHGHYCLPILSGSKLLGVLNLYTGENQVITPFEVSFLETVANVLATIIEHSQINEYKKAKQKADAENRAKSEFLATMSHEIRTPMNAILGMAELLQTEEDPNKTRYYSDTIVQAGETLLSIINDILDYSKIASGKLELEDADFDLHRLLTDMARLFEGFVKRKGIDFNLQIHPDLPRWVRGDSVRVWQVIINLISNAVKFTEKGGVLLMADPLPHSKKGKRICFQVQDTGIGISPEMFSKLFQSFEQGDKSITRRYGGTGLGLAITQMLVKLMEGSVEVDSTPDVGSTFRVTLDLGEPRGNSPSDPSMDDPVLVVYPEDTKVLVVEDDAINRAVVVGMLRRLGLHADVVENGLLALEKLQDTVYDIVFMDCQMPKMDGYSACTAFREMESAKNSSVRTPVVALTAFSTKGDREKCLNAGMDDFLTKPVRSKDFKVMLSRWLILEK